MDNVICDGEWKTGPERQNAIQLIHETWPRMESPRRRFGPWLARGLLSDWAPLAELRPQGLSD